MFAEEPSESHPSLFQFFPAFCWQPECIVLGAWLRVYLLVDCFTCLPYPQPFQPPWLMWDTRNRLSFFPFILNKQRAHGCSDKSRETSYSHHFIGLA